MKRIPPTLPSHLLARLEQYPERPALAFVDRHGGFTWQSYQQVYQRAARYAAGLAERGLSRGDVCVLAMPSDISCASTLLGVLLSGAVPVLVAPPLVRGLHSNLPEALRYVVRKTRARLVVTERDLSDDLLRLASSGGPARIVFDALELEQGEGDRLPSPSISGDYVVALQLTSGTTGFPKICVWKQERVIAALDGMAEAMKLASTDVCVNWTPLYHDMGLVNNFFLCLTKGIPLALLDTMEFVKRPCLWLQSLDATKASVTWSPNFGFALAAQRVRDREMDGVRLDQMRAFWNAAERIHPPTMKAFTNRFRRFGLRPESLKTNFGCAENIGGATFSDVDGESTIDELDAKAFYERGRAVPVSSTVNDTRRLSVASVGRPYPGLEVQIRSRNGRVLPDGRVGEIALASPSRMSGYLGNARETRRTLRHGWIYTGDRGYLRDGELFWVGRTREQINLRGKKLDPSDFENALLAVDGLRQGCFAAFGVDDPELGTQRLIIVSEVRQPPRRPYDTIRKEVSESIATRIGVGVSEVLLLPQGSMSKTSSGKRRHHLYRQLYLQGELRSVAQVDSGY